MKTLKTKELNFTLLIEYDEENPNAHFLLKKLHNHINLYLKEQQTMFSKFEQMSWQDIEQFFK